MMRYPEKEITLKDGTVCLLRSAAPDDAQAMIDYMKNIYEETDFLARYPGEFDPSMEDEVKFLQSQLDHPGCVMLTVFKDGKVLGNSGIGPTRRGRKFTHRCSIGVALRQEFCSRGLGTILLTEAAEQAKAMGYTQMELEVFAKNTCALGLYQKMGFVECGRMPNAACQPDGTIDDEIMMVKKLY